MVDYTIWYMELYVCYGMVIRTVYCFVYVTVL